MGGSQLELNTDQPVVKSAAGNCVGAASLWHLYIFMHVLLEIIKFPVGG